MMKFLYAFFAVILVTTVLNSQTIPVTIRVNMGARVYNNLWDPAKDSITIRGDFQVDAGDAINWAGFAFKMSGSLVDTIYSVTLNLPATKVGTEYQYKYVIGPDKWEGADNRFFTLGNTATELPTYWFNNDSTYSTVPIVTNTFNFYADVSIILGTGIGYFNPARDSLQVVGLDWDGYGTVLSGNRTLVADSLIIGLYKTTMVVKGLLGDSCKWKFKLFPDSLFSNSGYEGGGDRWLVFRNDGAIINLPTIVPRFGSFPPSLSVPKDILFECNLNVSQLVNAKNGRSIPLDSVLWVGIKGGSPPLGSWGGNWTLSDTVTPNPTLIKLFDNGLDGDKIAGDKIFSKTINFPIYTPAGAIEYKYGAMYPSALQDGGLNTPLDNEFLFGGSHVFLLTNTTPSRLYDNFGNNVALSINGANELHKYSLSQNYPNAFNPTTTIRFTVPVDGNVVLKVYNVMGQEVATLVNEYVKAGAKEATFNASNMPSGMYVYSIKAGTYSATKKMMLLK